MSDSIRTAGRIADARPIKPPNRRVRFATTTSRNARASAAQDDTRDSLLAPMERILASCAAGGARYTTEDQSRMTYTKYKGPIIATSTGVRVVIRQ